MGTFPPVDRDTDYMREMWGTTKLVTDYDQNEKMNAKHDFLQQKNVKKRKINLANHQHQKMLREIANDDLTPKKHDFKTQNELHDSQKTRF